MTNIVSCIDSWRKIRTKHAAQSIGFIPTMGNLHAGHMSLCKCAKEENDVTVASIFVNPHQFNQAQDYTAYPRTIDADHALLQREQVDYLFLPDANAMYADNYQVQVSETNLSQELEGEFRPGHFTGMLTIVLKLLNIIAPTRAYFGEKDYQQQLLVKKMVSALFLPIDIISCETIRATSGLALSSRNSRLNANQSEKALLFAKLLQSSLQPQAIIEQLTAAGFKVEYIAEKWGRRLGAVWLDEVRLIDNVALSSIL
ncbi:MAG: pantoate--beta-alanine ligase [Gammaproteobacteria bacterium RIFCSPHIGHO2_12_FULL_38_14]|nr:MAG: pantoate--beta-alanine ligase [Gammaproteobacteria bacterium RIFCSPHIGHO2_12_FULL_38_14]